VSISPFSYTALDSAPADAGGADAAAAALRAHVGRDYALTNSGRHALDLILRDLHLQTEDVVTIVTTSGTGYVSGCVTGTIQRHCRWSMRMEERTRAVVAIHEWGRPCERAREFVGLGVPLIEDCAYAFASRYAAGEPVGTLGDYALFSLSKMFTVNFGGLAVGPPGGRLAFAMPRVQRDYLLARIWPELADLPGLVHARAVTWRALAERFAGGGAPAFFEPISGEVPSVYMFAVDTGRVSLEQVKQRFQAHGIESSVFYGSDAVYIPCHHRVGAGTREFMFQIYRDLVEAADVGTPDDRSC
jgi:hypothetical protein